MKKMQKNAEELLARIEALADKLNGETLNLMVQRLLGSTDADAEDTGDDANADADNAKKVAKADWVDADADDADADDADADDADADDADADDADDAETGDANADSDDADDAEADDDDGGAYAAYRERQKEKMAKANANALYSTVKSRLVNGTLLKGVHAAFDKAGDLLLVLGGVVWTAGKAAFEVVDRRTGVKKIRKGTTRLIVPLALPARPGRTGDTIELTGVAAKPVLPEAQIGDELVTPSVSVYIDRRVFAGIVRAKKLTKADALVFFSEEDFVAQNTKYQTPMYYRLPGACLVGYIKGEKPGDPINVGDAPAVGSSAWRAAAERAARKLRPNAN